MTDTPTDEREVAEGQEESDTFLPQRADRTAAPEAEPIPFWQRPYVERFLVPLVLPVAVIVGLVAYILNISRVFLAGHGHIPVIVGSIITFLILLGATLLSAASPRMRQSAITLVSAGFILSIMSAGWLVLGHSQPEETGPTELASDVKSEQTLAVIAAPGGNLKFAPSELAAKTGLAKIEVDVAAPGHNFGIHQADTLFKTLELLGSKDDGVAFFPTPGKYEFFCGVPGHEAGGMKGTITVTGAPMTLDAALTAAGNAPTAAH